MPMSPRLLRPVASGRFDPRRISGLEAWYAADVASSITIETGVQQWSDLSGKGRHLTQAVTNNQPAYSSVTLNGKPTVTFDGQNDTLRTANFSSAISHPHSYYMVFRLETEPAANQFAITAGDASQTPSRSGEVFLSNFSSMSLFAGSTLVFNTFPAGAPGNFNIWDAEYNGASSQFRYRKNVASISGNTGSGPMYRITLAGSGGATPGSLSHISWAELAVFSRILTVAEADAVRKYLGTKWNLAFQA